VKVLGINILTGKIYYCVVEGTKTSPLLIEKDRIVTITSAQVPSLMDWFETTFENLINRINPDKIAYRQSLNLNKAQQYNISYPHGILNLLAHKKHISIQSWVPQNFVASKLGLLKGTNLLEKCDLQFGKNPPYWDSGMKNSILSAWMAL
jgi:Holliday junction resolvasome RuvABC endonuclease subunit